MIPQSQKSLIAAGSIAILVLLVNIALDQRNLSRIVENEQWVAHTHAVRHSLAAVNSGVSQLFAEHRGYVIGGNQQFLESYQASHQFVRQAMEELAMLTKDNSRQVRNIVDLDLLIKDAQEWAAKNVTVYQTQGPAAAREAIKRLEGHTRYKKIVAVVVEMDAIEQKLLQERSDLAEGQYRSSQMTSLSGGALSLAVFSISLLLVRNDTIQRNKVENELRQSEARFRVLTESIPQKIWSADANGELTYVNNQWVEYTGIQMADALAGRWQQSIDPADLSNLAQNWRRAVENGFDRFEATSRIIRSSDSMSRWHRTRAVSLKSPSGDVLMWIGSATDIDDEVKQSERLDVLVRHRTRELEHAVASLQTEIEERLRLEARDREISEELRRSNQELEKFAYVASHDLQEPLRKIQAFADRLVRTSRAEVGEKGKEYIDRILESAGRMRRLIDDLLTFSRVSMKPLTLLKIDLNEILAEVLSDLEYRRTRENGDVTVGLLPKVLGDATQLRQLFQNLVDNGLKFHKPDCPPHVAISAVRIEDDPDPHRRIEECRGWRIIVADTGIGFEPEFSERIFEIFQRLHGRGFEGTGIGLAVCRKIAERHGGTLKAYGQLGEGAEFVLDFPSANEEAPQSPTVQT